MTNLYAEWKKLKNNAEGTSARLYYTKNENTEREFDEAVEALVNFEKENGIPPMADEVKVKEMFCPQTNEEWFCGLSTEEKADWLDKVAENCCQICDETNKTICRSNIAWGCKFESKQAWESWLKEVHK